MQGSLPGRRQRRRICMNTSPDPGRRPSLSLLECRVREGLREMVLADRADYLPERIRSAEWAERAGMHFRCCVSVRASKLTARGAGAAHGCWRRHVRSSPGVGGPGPLAGEGYIRCDPIQSPSLECRTAATRTGANVWQRRDPLPGLLGRTRPIPPGWRPSLSAGHAERGTKPSRRRGPTRWRQ